MPGKTVVKLSAKCPYCGYTKSIHAVGRLMPNGKMVHVGTEVQCTRCDEYFNPTDVKTNRAIAAKVHKNPCYGCIAHKSRQYQYCENGGCMRGYTGRPKPKSRK